MDLYHADLGLPAGFRLPNRVVRLKWTNHANSSRKNDRYGLVPEIPIINLGEFETVEVGIENRRVKKVVVRAEFDDDNDIVLVLIPGGDVWTVKTVWLNRWDDTHKTLDKSKYVC